MRVRACHAFSGHVLLRKPSAAEDVVQDAIVALHSHGDRVRNQQYAAGPLHLR